MHSPRLTSVLTFVAFGCVLGTAGTAVAHASVPKPGSFELAVVDAETGEPVPFANFVRTDGSPGTLAGADGLLRVSVPAPATCRGFVSHVSYESSAEFEIEIAAGETARFRLALRPAVHEIPSVEIRAKHLPLSREAAGARTVKAEDVSSLPNPADDVFRMMRHLPGVSTDDVGGEFYVRGGSMDETLVRIDGLEVRHLFHGREFRGVTGILPFSVVDQMDVYTGGFPASYGGRLSGVIDLDLRSDGEPGLHGLAGADGVSARVLTEYNSEPASVLLSVREGYLDRVLTAVQGEAVIQPAYRDLLLRSVWRPNAVRTLSLNYLRSEDHLLYDDGVPTHYIDTDYLDHYLWASGRILLSRGFSLRGTAYGAWSHQDRVIDAYGRDDRDSNRAGGRVEVSFSARDRHLVTIGGQLDREWGSYSLLSREIVSATADGDVRTTSLYEDGGPFDRTQLALFAQNEWSPFSRLGLNLGFRASRDAFAGTLRIDPRLSAALQLDGDVTVRGAWGRYDQDPELKLDPTGTQAVPGQRAARARHIILGVEKAIGSVRVGLDVYDKDLRQLDEIISRTINGEIEHHEITRGRARGLEIFVQRGSNSSNWWLAYSLGRSQWGNEERTFIRDFDRLHSFSLANTFRISSDWDVGMSYTFHSGTPYTEQSWAQQIETGEWALSEGFPNGSRLPAYQRFDARIRRHFRFDRWEMSVYAEALNLTNHDNVIWYSWGFRDVEGGRVPHRVTRTGMPSVPSVGLEVRF